MGQFEYSVPLSPVKPKDMDRVIAEYKQKKERDEMIKHEFGNLVLDMTISKEDHEAINSFIHEQILKERHRIYEQLAEQSRGYDNLSIAKFKLKRIIDDMEDGMK